MMNINWRSLTGVLIIFMLSIEAFIQVNGFMMGAQAYNGASYRGSFVAHQEAFQLLGLHQDSPVYAYLSYAFVHAGLLHVGMNMLVMAQMGAPTETMMGTTRYAMFSIIAAIFCGVLTYAVMITFRSQPFVLVGYSGVLFAYVGYYIRIAMARHRDKVQFLVDFAKRNVILIAFIFVPLMFPQLGISGEAHLFGAIFGFVFAPLFKPKTQMAP